MQVRCGCSRFCRLGELFFCHTCDLVRCEDCTLYEPVTWFCSQCLAESTALGARAGGNRCTRNCALCPLCSSPLAVTSQENKDGLEGKMIKLKCRQCDYYYILAGENISVGKQLMQIEREKFTEITDFVNKNMPALDEPLDFELSMLNINEKQKETAPRHNPKINGDKPVPIRARMRAKFDKRCIKCSFLMVSVDRQVRKVAFRARHVAAEALPRLELYSLKDEHRLVVWAPAGQKKEMRVVIGDEEVLVPPPLQQQRQQSPEGNQGESPTDSRQFPYPLFLVTRESLASRQAFMRGESRNTSGPGWAYLSLQNEDVPKNGQFTCTYSGRKFEAKLDAIDLPETKDGAGESPVESLQPASQAHVVPE